MNRLLALVQREFWENKGALRTTPLVIGGIYIVFREIGGQATNRYLRSFTAAVPAALQRGLRAFRKSPPAGD